MKLILSLSLISLLTSCGHLYTHRDYTAEMEHNDSKFYEPRVDFPIVVGDSGELHESRRTRQARTPAAQQDVQDYLVNELRELEAKLSLNEFSQYEEYESKLPTVSEKIYFLKLPRTERKYYLISKGLMEDETLKVSLWEPQEKAEIERSPSSESDIWPFREYLKQESP